MGAVQHVGGMETKMKKPSISVVQQQACLSDLQGTSAGRSISVVEKLSQKLHSTSMLEARAALQLTAFGRRFFCFISPSRL